MDGTIIHDEKRHPSSVDSRSLIERVLRRRRIIRTTKRFAWLLIVVLPLWYLNSHRSVVQKGSAAVSRSMAFVNGRASSLVSWMGRINTSAAPAAPAPEKPSPSVPKAEPVPTVSELSTERFQAEKPPESPTEFVALRYDASRIFFYVTDLGRPGKQFSDRFHPIGSPPDEVISSPLWDPDAEVLNQGKKVLERIHIGEGWQLEGVSALPVPFVIEKPIVGSLGCAVQLGFMAKVAGGQESIFAASQRKYFLIHPVNSSSGSTAPPPASSSITELAYWSPSDDFKAQLEQLLQTRMKEEMPRIRTQVATQYLRAEERKATWPQQWKKFDAALERGEARLDFQTQAFRLTPDGNPRLFVRAKWAIGDVTVFLMNMWLRVQPKLAIESMDSSASAAMRSGDPQDMPMDFDYAGRVLNVLDRDHDGWGELLIYTPGMESFEIREYRYTQFGPVRKEIAYGGGSGC